MGWGLKPLALRGSNPTQLSFDTADCDAMTTEITNQMFAYAGGGIVVFALIARFLIRG